MSLLLITCSKRLHCNYNEVLLAMIGVLATAIGVVSSGVGLMFWLVKCSDRRQDSTIVNNTNVLKKNNDAYIALSKSINDSTAASRSLEESIRKRDEQDSQFQAHVLEGFETQGKLLKGISEKSDRMLKVLKASEKTE